MDGFDPEILAQVTGGSSSPATASSGFDPDILAQVTGNQAALTTGDTGGFDPKILAEVTGQQPHPGAYRDRGALNNILWTLGLLDRPRNAVASGIANIQDDDPNTGFWSGAKAGLMGDRHTSFGDVLGIPETQSTDSWPEYLAKGGARLATDVVLDPLNLLFGAGAITKGLKLSKDGVSLAGRLAGKAGEGLHALGVQTPLEYAAGSQAGKALFNKIPDQGFETLVNQVKREGSMYPVEKTAREWKKAYTEAGVDSGQIFNALERGTKDEAIVPYLEAGRKLQDINTDLRMQNDAMRQSLGIEPKGLIGDERYTYMPRILSGKGRWELGQWKSSGNADAFKKASRELYAWENPVTHEMMTVGSLEKTPRISEGAKGEFLFDMGKGKEPVLVQPVQADLAQVHQMFAENKSLGRGAEAMKPFIEDPADALYSSIAKNQRENDFLKILTTGKQEGWLTDLTEPMAQLRGSLTKTVEGTGWLSPRDLERSLTIPGFEGLKAPKPIANRLENLYGAVANPKSAVGAIEQMFQAFRNTSIGQALNSYTSMWKRGTLAIHPGFHFANAVSNQFLMWMADVRNPARIAEAAAVQLEKGKPVVEGFTNAALNYELKLRDVLQERAAGLLAGGDDTGQLLSQAEKIPFSEMITGKLGKTGSVIQKGVDLGRKANDAGFALGGAIENNARAAVAIDWLKKNVKGVPTPADLDAAAAHAKAYLFDYGDLTPIMKGLKQFLPFVSWTRSIAGRTLKDISTQPQELANIGRFVDAVFQAPDERQRALMDPWQQNQGPAFGMFGWSPTSPEGLPGQFQTSRFIPQGTIEQLMGGFRQNTGEGLSSMGSEIMGMLAPWAKAGIEVPFNYSQFLRRPIDEIAPNPVAAMTNPITGGPYQAANQKFFGANMPSMWQTILGYTPQARTINMANAQARGTLFEDPSQPQMSPFEKAAYLLTGGRAYSFDEAKQMLKQKRNESKTLAAVKSKMNIAASKGDEKSFNFYLEQYQKIQQEQIRARGMVEPGA